MIQEFNAVGDVFRLVLNEYLGCKNQNFYWSACLLTEDLQLFLHQSGGMAGAW